MQKDKWGVINNSGKILTDYQFDSINNFSEGMAAVMKEGKWGFIDASGKTTIDCQYDLVKDFSEGMAAVMQEEKWGFIDKHGNLRITLQYDDVGDFSEGKVSVKLSKYKNGEDEWAYIDNKNNIVIDFYPYNASGDQMFVVGEFNDNLAFVSKTLLSIIDDNGNNVFLGGNSKFFIGSLSYNKEFDVIPAYIYVDDTMKIKKYGLTGLDGDQKLEPIFDNINEVFKNYIVVESIINNDSKKGVIRIFTE